MKYVTFILLFILIGSICYGQSWSGIIDTTRATDWTFSGVDGDIPSASWPLCNNTNCNNIAPGCGGGCVTVTSAVLNTAISGAQYNGVACSYPTNPCVVKVRAGSWTLSAGYKLQISGVVVRGEGADQTFFTATGISGTGCGTFFNDAVAMCTGNSTSHSANWTAGYSQGTTVITVASTASMTVGQPIFLVQDDDASDGYPATGDLDICATASTSCSAVGDGATYFVPDPGKSAWSGYKIAAISGSSVTLDHGVILPMYRSGQNPKAWWYNSNVFLQYSGVEDMSIDYSALTDDIGVICVYCFNTWEKGVRSISASSPTQHPHHWAPILTYRATARSNYWYGPDTASGSVNQYSLSEYMALNCVWENNINQQTGAGLITDAPGSGLVVAYNFFPGRNDPVMIHHAAGEMMDLIEGNIGLGFYGDIVHGTHFMNTLFRNAWVGLKYTTGTAGTLQDLIGLQTKNRFFNILGNVMYGSYVTTYQADQAGCGTCVYDTGFKGTNSGSDPGNDARVKATLYRFGNWDNVTNATRWCGNSGSTGWATTCSSTSEVPTGITNYSQAVPAAETFPNSFYYSAKPSWFRSVAWPPIGPDVTGGNITNMGGHANLNPAADCYLNVMGGPSDGSGSVLTFNAATCYTPPACTPDHLTFTAQPSSATLGSSVGTVSVGVYDSGSVLCSTATNSVTLAKSAGSTYGTLTSASSLTKSASSGVATWSDPDLTITVSVGTGGITATATALTGATSNTFTITTPAGASNAGRLWKVPIALLLVEPPPMIVYPPMKIKGENR